MNWEGIVAIATCVGLVITIVGFVFATGKLVARFENLEGRVKEDREKNSDQHAEFYDTIRAVTTITVEVKNLGSRFDELRDEVKEVLSRFPKGA
jgi:hypothetical protein